MAVYLLIVKYIYITLGLCYDFIYAWRSGRKPSPINDTSNKKQLKIVIGLSDVPY